MPTTDPAADKTASHNHAKDEPLPALSPQEVDEMIGFAVAAQRQSITEIDERLAKERTLLANYTRKRQGKIDELERERRNRQAALARLESGQSVTAESKVRVVPPAAAAVEVPPVTSPTPPRRSLFDSVRDFVETHTSSGKMP
jgi:ABC-type uncharacterized transport system ATPase subunit